jgi:hypothetical protein
VNSFSVMYSVMDFITSWGSMAKERSN